MRLGGGDIFTVITVSFELIFVCMVWPDTVGHNMLKGFISNYDLILWRRKIGKRSIPRWFDSWKRHPWMSQSANWLNPPLQSGVPWYIYIYVWCWRILHYAGAAHLKALNNEAVQSNPGLKHCAIHTLSFIWRFCPRQCLQPIQAPPLNHSDLPTARPTSQLSDTDPARLPHFNSAPLSPSIIHCGLDYRWG